MMHFFPLKYFGASYPIPKEQEQGSFGFKRKFDFHTGIDLYCSEGTEVVACEDGFIVNIEEFTGPNAGSPWWYPTKSVLVRGKTGVIVYGEIQPFPDLFINKKVYAGESIGNVLRVLKRNKGVTPTSMLHFEIMSSESKETIIWSLSNKERPRQLIDPRDFLLKSIR